MNKKYILSLSEHEVKDLKQIIRNRSSRSLRVRRAQALLMSAEGQTDHQIAAQVDMSTCSVERLRQRAVLDGVEIALEGKPRQRAWPRTFDGAVEAHLVALRCSAPPEGHAHWTLHLLADQMVTLGYVEAISHESVRQILKKTRSSRGANAAG